MRILLTGASGFVGSALMPELLANEHQLKNVTRNRDAFVKSCDLPVDVVEWDMGEEEPPNDLLKDVDGIIHLAGEPVMGRWNATKKERIYRSRVESTRKLVNCVQAQQSEAIRFFISASAIGFYPSQGDDLCHEDSPPGDDFMSEVCVQWERSSLALPKSVRRTLIRIGLVLGYGQGALSAMTPIFRTGLAGKLGSGKQWMSWIHIDDLVAMFVRAVDDSQFDGTFNGVAPNPVRNEQFTETLARIMHRPAFLPAPKLGLHLVLGEASKIVLNGPRVEPQAALAKGFTFKFSRVGDALLDVFQGDGLSFQFHQQQWFDRAIEDVFSFFSDAQNLEAVTPPWLQFKITSTSEESMKAGMLIDYRLKIRGIPVSWQTKITSWQPPHLFRDSQLKGPYAKWDHQHAFREIAGGTLMRDVVLYRLPMGYFGSIGQPLVHRDVSTIFRFRYDTMKRLLSSPSQPKENAS